MGQPQHVGITNAQHDPRLQGTPYGASPVHANADFYGVHNPNFYRKKLFTVHNDGRMRFLIKSVFCCWRMTAKNTAMQVKMVVNEVKNVRDDTITTDLFFNKRVLCGKVFSLWKSGVVI